MQNKKVLLIFPKDIGDVISLDNEVYCPLPLLYLSIPLINKKIDVQIIDQRFEDNAFDEINKAINQNIVCVGINLLSIFQIKHVSSLVKHIRKNYPDTKIVIGGIAATLLSDKILNGGYADFVVSEEGEETFSELVDSFIKRGDHSKIKGIIYKEEGKIIKTPKREIISLDDYVDLPYHLIKKYEQNYDYYYLITSRGCNSKCSFCFIQTSPNCKWRGQSPKIILKQTIALLSLGHKFIIYNDDNFFVDLSRIKEFLSYIKKYNLDFRWAASARIDTICRYSDNFLKELNECGMKELYFGGESGSDRILGLLNKKISVGMIKKVNIRLKSFNIKPEYAFMENIPTETDEEREDTIKLISRLKKDNPDASIVGPITYFPIIGTKLYEDAIKGGFSPPKKFEEWGDLPLYIVEDFRGKIIKK